MKNSIFCVFIITFLAVITGDCLKSLIPGTSTPYSSPQNTCVSTDLTTIQSTVIPTISASTTVGA